ncbi:signal peptidase [Chryseobacterium arthrosphaerae]|uniref:signal peptidase n=1 Tax=Chryseobacterium arthrosphaerae TaxID=651561 RepID=UPI001BB0ABB2|nr:signal peptidase [Chryseobacterium arthrosphaerae]QUY55920.1 signal peptidase [Chryseobacterium arthrosphaerae]UEQ75777.1 signal peptidase [Chryseobacterium arthrosphaerae]WES97079.1 signal peptidase [Chryseobacterium arthrosphaerae]
MKTINKLVSALLLFVISFAYAEEIPPAPASAARGTGGGGPGAPASPIDMYVYVLGIVAIAFIIYYTKKYKSVKA